MEIFKLPAALRLVKTQQGLSTRRTKPKLLVLALALVFAGTAVPTTADAKGLLEILFGIHSPKVTQLSNVNAKVNLKLSHRVKLRHSLAAIKQRLVQSCSGLKHTVGGNIWTNGSNQCGSLAGGSGGFAFVSVAAGGGSSVVSSGGGTVIVPGNAHGSFIALSGTVGFNGTVTVPGGQSVNVAGFQTVGGGISVPLTTAPRSSSGFGSGWALGSASSIGAGSAASNSAGFGNSFTQTATSGVGATSSGGSGNAIGAGLGLGGGVGIAAGIH